MALGFIKKMFSFGKDTTPAPTPEAEPTAAQEALILDEQRAVPAETETVNEPALDPLLEEAEAANPGPATAPAEDDEPDIYPLPHAPDLPLAEDPVIEPEIETAAGPSGDDVTDGVVERDDDTPEIAADFDEPASVEVEATAESETDTPTYIAASESLGETGLPREEQTAETPDAAESKSPALPKGFATADRRKAEEPVPVSAAPKRTWFQRLRDGLSRTSSQLTGQIASLFTKRKLDDDTLQDLEDLLIQADLGVETALRITDALAAERYGKDVSGSDVSRIMAGEITKVLAPVAKPLELDLSHKPHVILVVGVNGTGKTTTIGKLAAKLSGAGLKVMMAAGDTFRAAAIEQLRIWAERTGSDIVATKLGADAAGLAYEAFEKAREKKSDVLIIDTAGRLQNKAELMAELEKIVRVLGKLDPDAPHTVLQTLDATTGQNAMNQVEIFRNVAGVSGLIMTKLDGTARGGILVAIAAKHKLPVYFIGVGEGVDDLEPFEAKDFAQAIAGVPE
jgi:fused signal recognition particle receptor